MTKDLPLVKKLSAKVIHAIQKQAVKYPKLMGVYYSLAKVHFKLHYGFELTNDSNLTAVHVARAYAIKRHLRIVVNSGLISQAQVKVFRPQLEQAFLDGVNGLL